MCPDFALASVRLGLLDQRHVAIQRHLDPGQIQLGHEKRHCISFGWFHSRASTNEGDEYLKHCDWTQSLYIYIQKNPWVKIPTRHEQVSRQ